MKKALRSLFLGRDALISPKIMQPIQFPWGEQWLVQGPHHSHLSAARLISRLVISLGPLWVDFLLWPGL